MHREMKSRSWETRRRVGGEGEVAREVRYRCSQIMPRRSRKLVGSSRIRMSVSWSRAAARAVRIFQPPEKLETGWLMRDSVKPRPARIFFALDSKSASFEGSTWSWRSASISAASLVSLASVSGEMSSSFSSYCSLNFAIFFSITIKAFLACIPLVPLRSLASLSFRNSSFCRRSC